MDLTAELTWKRVNLKAEQQKPSKDKDREEKGQTKQKQKPDGLTYKMMEGEPPIICSSMKAKRTLADMIKINFSRILEIT